MSRANFVEEVAIGISNKSMIGGAATGFLGWLASVNWIGLAGVMVAFIGMVASIWFQWRRDRRESLESRERIEAIRSQCEAGMRGKQGGKIHPRMLVAVLSLSAAGFIGIASHEGYTERAAIPTKGDVPTVGFGSTVHEDGTRVKMGDNTDPVRALIKAAVHIEKDERLFRDSLPGVALTQAEYDLYLDFTYQYGINNWRSSSMRRHLLAGEYREACDALLRWRFAAGYDCSTKINGQPNRRCWGVWTRQQERHAKCVAAL